MLRMLRMLAGVLVTLASGAGFAQMMGGQMSTSQYFPLVDGARYDYVFLSGSPWGGHSGVWSQSM
jgi:hypothetical protein